MDSIKRVVKRVDSSGVIRNTGSDDGATRKRKEKREKYVAPWSEEGPEYDPLLPYGPKVYLARKPKPDPWWVTVLEVVAVVGVLCFFVYMYYYIDHLHFHVTKAYAHMGSSDAQHVLAHKYLQGKGTDKDEGMAMHWFRQAAEKGHPQSSYNLVAGHMQGYDVDLEEHEIEHHLKTAHESGMEEATQALKDMYPHKY